MNILLKNNLIAVFTYMGISILAFVLHMFYLDTPFIFSRDMELSWLVIQALILGIHTFVSLGLCFWVGRKLLKSTGNIFLNGLSVVAVVIFIIVALYLSSIVRSGYFFLLVAPINPISLTIVGFTDIKQIYIWFAMSPLPFIAMWMGIMSKKYNKRKKV